MRRTLALLALLVMSWSQVAALHCEMRSAGGGSEVSAAAGAHADGGSAHEGHGEREHHEHGTPSSDDCGLLMSCGTAAVGAPGLVAPPLLGLPTLASLVGAPSTPAGVVVAFEPPPPRAVV